MYRHEHLHNSIVTHTFLQVSWYICTFAALGFLALRITVRIQRFRHLYIDDYLIILSSICLVGDLAIQQHMWNLGMSNIGGVDTPTRVKIFKMIIPGSTLYITSLWSIKIALVVFYKRLAARTTLYVSPRQRWNTSDKWYQTTYLQRPTWSTGNQLSFPYVLCCKYCEIIRLLIPITMLIYSTDICLHSYWTQLEQRSSMSSMDQQLNLLDHYPYQYSHWFHQ